MPYHIHWFKKNLRFQDNEILLKTYNSSPILLYIIEPELWLQKDMSQRQWEFIWESLKSLKIDLAENNLHLNILFGDTSEIFKKVNSRSKNKNRVDKKTQISELLKIYYNISP